MTGEWRCFICGSHITNSASAVVDYATDDFESYATIRMRGKGCHGTGGPTLSYWVPALAFDGPRGVARAAMLADRCSMDAGWLLRGALARVDQVDWESGGPERAAIWLPLPGRVL